MFNAEVNSVHKLYSDLHRVFAMNFPLNLSIGGKGEGGLRLQQIQNQDSAICHQRILDFHFTQPREI